MGRIEFPSTPINAKADAAKPEQNGKHPEYVQPAFDWLESEQEPLIELGNCVVTSPVSFKKRVKGNEWRCSIHVEPDLLHQEQIGDYEAYANHTHADRVQSSHLRPGDRATMRGHFRQEVIELANGDERVTNYLSVTEVEVLSRSPRKSITVYEQHNNG